MRALLLMLATLALAGCGKIALAWLTAEAPSFELSAHIDATTGEVLLEAMGYDLSDTLDSTCEGKSQGCEPDLFLGFQWYRSVDGAYGTYESRGEPAKSDDATDPPFAAAVTITYRAAMIRQRGSDEPRVDNVSTAVDVIVRPCQTTAECGGTSVCTPLFNCSTEP